MRDPVTLLFPFQLAALPSGDTTTVDLDTIYNLLRAQPEVMRFFSLERQDNDDDGDRSDTYDDETTLYPVRADSNKKRKFYSSIEQRCPTFIQDAMIGTVTAALIGVAAGSIFRVD